jgi:hypothetical protein
MVPSLFLLLLRYDCFTSLVGRQCLGYVSLGGVTSDACINFRGLVSNRSHSHASCFLGRQPLVAQPLQSSLPWTISVPLLAKIIASTTHISSPPTQSLPKHPTSTQCLPHSLTYTLSLSSARSRKTASSVPTSTLPSPTQ